MITLEYDCLVFRQPEAHQDAACTVHLQRTLRIPDNEHDYPLPPGLGRFPLRHLDDHAERLPEAWRRRGGVITPMHQAEAMWLAFSACGGEHGVPYPFALKIGTGKVNAVSGEAWTDHLNRDPQDYVVIPTQPWLDGYCVEEGIIRQFVAMPLGEGFSVEKQLTGAAEHGGLQILAVPMKAERYERLLERERRAYADAPAMMSVIHGAMGLAPGGRMRQQVYDDRYGLDAWDQRHASRCFVTILNSVQWMVLTGERPPSEPPTAEEYTKAGLPWFEYYDADARAIAATERLGKIRSIAQMRGDTGRGEADLAEPMQMQKLRAHRRRPVRETAF